MENIFPDAFIFLFIYVLGRLHNSKMFLFPFFSSIKEHEILHISPKGDSTGVFYLISSKIIN